MIDRDPRILQEDTYKGVRSHTPINVLYTSNKTRLVSILLLRLSWHANGIVNERRDSIHFIAMRNSTDLSHLRVVEGTTVPVQVSLAPDSHERAVVDGKR